GDYVTDATANELASVHLTSAVHPPIWAAIIMEAAASVLEGDIRFHRAPPLGYSRSYERRRSAETALEGLLDALRTQLSGPALVAQTSREAFLDRRPALSRHLVDLEEIGRAHM